MTIAHNLTWRFRGRCGCDRMVFGFTTTYAISAYHHWCREIESWSERGVQHYVKVCHWHVTSPWFSLGPSISSSNKTDHHEITEILLKVALNTIKQTKHMTRQTRWTKNYYHTMIRNRTVYSQTCFSEHLY
jgi:hypothetical protein